MVAASSFMRCSLTSLFLLLVFSDATPAAAQSPPPSPEPSTSTAAVHRNSPEPSPAMAAGATTLATCLAASCLHHSHAGAREPSPPPPGLPDHTATCTALASISTYAATRSAASPPPPAVPPWHSRKTPTQPTGPPAAITAKRRRTAICDGRLVARDARWLPYRASFRPFDRQGSPLFG